MGVIKVPTHFNIELEFEIPEFYRRMLALMLDMLLQYFYLRIAGEIYSSFFNNSNFFDPDTSYNMWAFGLILLLPIMVYHLAMEITLNGQSLGKKIMGLRVVDEHGGKAGISQYLIRWLLRLSDLWIVGILFFLASGPSLGNLETAFIVLFGLGFLITDIVLVIVSRKGQRIGDILAHTILIRTSTRSDINETVFQEVDEGYKPSFPQIMQLSDRDINAIKSILEISRKKGDFTMAANASEKIKAHLRIETPLAPFDFLEVLLKDYNYLSTR
jgi:uncharacterized RDD family membrane protein YckC